MATVITSECINCGACEPECPNAAVYQGGVEWEIDGQTHPAVSEDTFYIVPEKCTECVGFFDQEACAAVCPVDCCIPDPDRPETEEVLLARAKALHPETTFGDDFPSRFGEGNGAGVISPTQPAGVLAAVGDGAAKETAVAAPQAQETSKRPAAEATKPVAVAPAADGASEPQAVQVAKPVAVAPAANGASEPQVAEVEKPMAAAPAASKPPEAAADKALAAADYETIPVPPIEDWEVSLYCFRCDRTFGVRFRQLVAGTVLNCTHCKGSYVPTSALCRAVEYRLKRFYGGYVGGAASFRARRGRELTRYREEQHRRLDEFEQRLRDLSRSVRAPGAPHRKRSIFGFK